MKHLRTLLCALAILCPTDVCQAQGAPNPQHEALLCSSFGLFFETVTVSRDKGISWKDELDSFAKQFQERPVEGIPPLAMALISQVMISNVYFHPLYKHLGPAMNKLTAESRCKQMGAAAFLDDLEAFTSGRRK